METYLTKASPKQPTPKRALILFTSHPTKEAFRKQIGQNIDQYQDIYQAFLHHTFQTITTAQETVNFDVIIASDAADEANIARAYNAFPDAAPYQFIAHSANSFGEKFNDAFDYADAAGYQQIAIIGNDCLDLTPELLCASFDNLANSDAVLGPAGDGGFYLLALNDYSPALFENICWCSGSVFQQLCQNIKQRQKTLALLPMLSDIDSRSDLNHWLCNQKKKPDAALAYQVLVNLLGVLLIPYFYCQPFLIKTHFKKQRWQKPPPAFLL